MGFLTSAVSNELLGNTYRPPHPKWPILQCTPCPDSTDVDDSASTMSIPGPSPSSRAHTLVAARLLKASNNAVNISRGDIILLLIPIRRDWRHRFTHVRWRRQELSSSRFSALSLIIIAAVVRYILWGPVAHFLCATPRPCSPIFPWQRKHMLPVYISMSSFASLSTHHCISWSSSTMNRGITVN